MIDINSCAYLSAYASARELDAILMELDRQYPNKSWQSPMLIGTSFMTQEEWESHKESYCKVEIQGSYGGSAHAMYYFGCIKEMNDNRLSLLKYLGCTKLEDFEWTCDD